MRLHNVVEGYITFKRKLGVRLCSEAGVLRAFCRSVGETEVADIKAGAVLAFIAGKGPVTRSWKQRASVLRSFYRYAISRGLCTNSPLPTNAPKFPPPRTPHIYSTDELNRLLEATVRLQTPRAPLRAFSYRMLLLLLYSTGMRISEALSLALRDVDLLNRVLTIRDTKFFKTRLIPIGPKLTRELVAYTQRRLRQSPGAVNDSSPLFATRSGGRWHCVVARELFRRIRRYAGVGREGNARYQPCLHDLRHTAAQHRIIAWYKAGHDVQSLLLHLATYLGHVDLASTQYYLTMTPELLDEASQRFQRYAQPGGDHE